MREFPDQATVLALLEEKHFGRAARRLGVSQPALTARLRRLEQRLKVRLFERGRGGVSVTPAGIAFAEGARRVLEAATEADNSARAAADGSGGVLRIGFTQIAASQVLAPTLARFRREHAGARVSLREATTATLERDLEQSVIDVALLHPPLYASLLSTRPLAKATIQLRNAHADGEGRAPIGIPRHEAPMLTTELDRISNRVLPGRSPQGQAEADTMIGALALSAAGYGPAITVSGFPNFGFKAQSAEEEGSLELVTSIAWRSLDRRPLVQAFLDLSLAVATAESGFGAEVPNSSR